MPRPHLSVSCSYRTKSSYERLYCVFVSCRVSFVLCVLVGPNPHLGVLYCVFESCFICLMCSCRPKSSLECLCCVFRADRVLGWLLLVFGVLALAGMTTVPVHAYVLVVSAGDGRDSEERTDDERSYPMDDYSQ